MRITIDEHPVDIEPGTTILQAAQCVGIEIPTLCYQEGMAPRQSCFLCAVEIEGKENLVPSCATVVEEGMVVRTGSPQVVSWQRTLRSIRREVHSLHVDSTVLDRNSSPSWSASASAVDSRMSRRS